MKIQINIDGKNIDAEISEEDAKELGLLDKRPQTGYERVEEKECYFVISAAGDVSKQIECKAISDQRRRDCGNYYSDEKIAENNAKADRLLRKLRQWQALNDEPISKKDCDKEKWTISYNHGKDSSGHDIGLEPRWLLIIHNFGTVFFTTKEKAKEAIKTFEDELTWYFTEYMQRLDEV